MIPLYTVAALIKSPRLQDHAMRAADANTLSSAAVLTDILQQPGLQTKVARAIHSNLAAVLTESLLL